MRIVKYYKGRCFAGEVATPYEPERYEKLRLSPYSEVGGYLDGQPRYFPVTKKDRQLLASAEEALTSLLD